VGAALFRLTAAFSTMPVMKTTTADHRACIREIANRQARNVKLIEAMNAIWRLCECSGIMCDGKPCPKRKRCLACQIKAIVEGVIG
jgi:hypothetical protein